MDTNTAATAAANAAISAEKAAVAAAVVGVNIDNIKVNIREIKDTLKEMTMQYVPRTDFLEHLKVDVDHENRLRVLEKIVVSAEEARNDLSDKDKSQDIQLKKLEEFMYTLIGKIWGIGIMAATAMSIIGILISHYWK